MSVNLGFTCIYIYIQGLFIFTTAAHFHLGIAVVPTASETQTEAESYRADPNKTILLTRRAGPGCDEHKTMNEQYY